MTHGSSQALSIKSCKGGLVDAAFVNSDIIRFLIGTTYVRCDWASGDPVDKRFLDEVFPGLKKVPEYSTGVAACFVNAEHIRFIINDRYVRCDWKNGGLTDNRLLTDVFRCLRDLTD